MTDSLRLIPRGLGFLRRHSLSCVPTLDSKGWAGTTWVIIQSSWKLSKSSLNGVSVEGVWFEEAYQATGAGDWWGARRPGDRTKRDRNRSGNCVGLGYRLQTEHERVVWMDCASELFPGFIKISAFEIIFNNLFHHPISIERRMCQALWGHTKLWDIRPGSLKLRMKGN